MLHSYMSVVCTYHCRGFLKKIFFLHKATSRVEEKKTIEWCLQGTCTYRNQVILLTVNHWYNSYHSSSENLVLDQLSSNWYLSLFSLFIWLKLCSYCREKFCLGHSWPGVKGFITRKVCLQCVKLPVWTWFL